MEAAPLGGWSIRGRRLLGNTKTEQNMDRKKFTEIATKQLENQRTTLQVASLGHMSALAEGQFDKAEVFLSEGVSAATNIQHLNALLAEAPKAYDSELEFAAQVIELGPGHGDSSIAQTRGERFYRVMQATFRAFVWEGVRVSPEHFALFFGLPPDEQKKLLDTYAPTKDMIKDGPPCDHTAPVISETYGTSVVCTECHTRMSALSMEVHDSAATVEGHSVRVVRKRVF